MTQRIEAPSPDDVDRIARQLVFARSLVQEATGTALSGGLDDLARLQAVLDKKLVEPEATAVLQALGIAFGKIFVDHNAGYDWWMVEDEYGRDAAIRWGETSLLVFAETMISKRVEDGEEVDVAELYEGLKSELERIIAEENPDA
jgi:hypothetical protein